MIDLIKCLGLLSVSLIWLKQSVLETYLSSMRFLICYEEEDRKMAVSHYQVLP